MPAIRKPPIEIRRDVPTMEEFKKKVVSCIFYCGLRCYDGYDMVTHDTGWRFGGWYRGKDQYYAHCGANEYGTPYVPFAWAMLPKVENCKPIQEVEG